MQQDNGFMTKIKYRERQAGRQTDRQAGRQTGRQAGRQADIYISKLYRTLATIDNNTFLIKLQKFLFNSCSLKSFTLTR